MATHARQRKGPTRTNLKGIKKRPRMLGPQTDREKAFCERWLIHFDKDRAFREAGYTAGQARGGHSALVLLERFADYLRPIKEAKAKIMAERLAIDSEKILEGMAGKVFFDPGGFYERATIPLTRKVKKPGQEELVEEEVFWDGQPVYGERLKPYSDLTREQQAVVEIVSTKNDQIHYRLPSIKEQHAYYTSLGRQIGMFSEKLILERHNHLHTHHQLDFSNVPTQKISALTRQLLPLVSQEFARSLGYTPEDIAEAQAEQGVQMPDKTPA